VVGVLPFLTHRLLIIFSVFYKIGSMVIGGGHVILPIMYSEFEAYHFISKEEFYNGFSLISILPGPMFNLCAYVGAVITNNFWGALSAFLGLYIPCFLFVMLVLPFWETYRRHLKLRAAINGICAVSVGLILSAAVGLYEQALRSKSPSVVWFVLVTINCCTCYWMVYKSFPIPVVFGLGELLCMSAEVVMSLPL
jgi:chromate transporter